MKKFTLLVLVVLSSQLLLAQTVISSAYNFDVGDTYKYDGYEGVTNIEPGPAGTNQSWNFETLVGYGFYEGIGNICVPVSETPFADSTGADGSNICVKNIGEVDSGPFQYYNQNNNVQELLAMGFVGDGNSTYTNYRDVLTAVEYPFAFGDEFDDNWIAWTFNVAWGFHFMVDTASATVEADAWGSITTPLGSYQNALRVKRTTIYTNYFRFVDGGDWNASGPFTDIEYLWYVPGIKVPVFILSDMEGFDDYGVRYLIDYNFTVATTEIEETTFELFPNPASNHLLIQSGKKIIETQIFSISGKLISTQSNTSHQIRIDIDSYPKGAYLMKVEFEDGSLGKEVFVKK